MEKAELKRQQQREIEVSSNDCLRLLAEIQSSSWYVVVVVCYRPNCPHSLCISYSLALSHSILDLIYLFLDSLETPSSAAFSSTHTGSDTGRNPMLVLNWRKLMTLYSFYRFPSLSLSISRSIRRRYNRGLLQLTKITLPYLCSNNCSRIFHLFIQRRWTMTHKNEEKKNVFWDFISNRRCGSAGSNTRWMICSNTTTDTEWIAASFPFRFHLLSCVRWRSVSYENHGNIF